jgi:hypothetical protein
MDRRTKRDLMARLTRDADRICVRFGLRYSALEPERANVKRRYGICYSDGTIKIRLRHVSTGRPLKYSSLVNTLCHELAHLRHFDHGPRFQQLYADLLAWSRHQGIYRPARRAEEGPPHNRAPVPVRAPLPAPAVPRPPARSGPEQLTLF